MVSEIAMRSTERQANRYEARQNVSAQWSGKPLRVGFVLTRDFTLSAFSDFVDLLRLAADDADHSYPIRCQWSGLSQR